MGNLRENLVGNIGGNLGGIVEENEYCNIKKIVINTAYKTSTMNRQYKIYKVTY